MYNDQRKEKLRNDFHPEIYLTYNMNSHGFS